jgi:hypothetical protein
MTAPDDGWEPWHYGAHLHYLPRRVRRGAPLIRPPPLRRGLGALSLAGYLWAPAAYEQR